MYPQYAEICHLCRRYLGNASSLGKGIIDAVNRTTKTLREGFLRSDVSNILISLIYKLDALQEKKIKEEKDRALSIFSLYAKKGTLSIAVPQTKQKYSFYVTRRILQNNSPQFEDLRLYMWKQGQMQNLFALFLKSTDGNLYLEVQCQILCNNLILIEIMLKYTKHKSHKVHKSQKNPNLGIHLCHNKPRHLHTHKKPWKPNQINPSFWNQKQIQSQHPQM